MDLMHFLTEGFINLYLNLKNQTNPGWTSKLGKSVAFTLTAINGNTFVSCWIKSWVPRTFYLSYIGQTESCYPKMRSNHSVDELDILRRGTFQILVSVTIDFKRN